MFQNFKGVASRHLWKLLFWCNLHKHYNIVVLDISTSRRISNLSKVWIHASRRDRPQDETLLATVSIGLSQSRKGLNCRKLGSGCRGIYVMSSCGSWPHARNISKTSHMSTENLQCPAQAWGLKNHNFSLQHPTGDPQKHEKSRCLLLVYCQPIRLLSRLRE